MRRALGTASTAAAAVERRFTGRNLQIRKRGSWVGRSCPLANTGGATLSRDCLQRGHPTQLRVCSFSTTRSVDDREEEDCNDQFWPDGTPKKFSGKDAWKNWVNWDSKFKNVTDELSRARKFFFEVDAKGKLFRLEIDHPERRFGELRQGRTLEHFFSHLAHNTTGEYEEQFPYVSLRMHERYFTRRSRGDAVKTDLTRTEHPRTHDIGSPMVFNDYDSENSTLFRRLPEGQTPKSLRVPLDFEQLRVSPDGQLFHLFRSKAGGAKKELSENQGSAADGTSSDDPSLLLALVEVSTAQKLFDEFGIEVVEDSEVPGGFQYLLHDSDGNRHQIRQVGGD